MAEIRDLLGTTRKYAVPICEYLDRIGLTKRDGDLRVLKEQFRVPSSEFRARKRRAGPKTIGLRLRELGTLNSELGPVVSRPAGWRRTPPAVACT